MSVNKPSKRVFSVNWRNKLLFTTSVSQVIERVHVIYRSWFSWRYDSLLRFGIAGPRFFLRVHGTMISNCFVKLGIIAYF